MMGDAYRDIVALAAGQHGDTYADSGTYKPEQANSRSRAVAEYRAGLALDDKSDTLGIARERLRLLQAGEAPHDTSFYCKILEWRVLEISYIDPAACVFPSPSQNTALNDFRCKVIEAALVDASRSLAFKCRSSKR
jgi:hypothetical protein